MSSLKSGVSGSRASRFLPVCTSTRTRFLLRQVLNGSRPKKTWTEKARHCTSPLSTAMSMASHASQILTPPSTERFPSTKNLDGKDAALHLCSLEGDLNVGAPLMPRHKLN